jgi:hypothetical protein
MLNNILESLPDHNFIKIEDFDNAVIGVTETDKGMHLLYSLSSIYKILIDDHGCIDHGDCHDWYYHNMLNLSSMENGPVFLEDMIVG